MSKSISLEFLNLLSYFKNEIGVEKAEKYVKELFDFNSSPGEWSEESADFFNTILMFRENFLGTSNIYYNVPKNTFREMNLEEVEELFSFLLQITKGIGSLNDKSLNKFNEEKVVFLPRQEKKLIYLKNKNEKNLLFNLLKNTKLSNDKKNYNIKIEDLRISLVGFFISVACLSFETVISEKIETEKVVNDLKNMIEKKNEFSQVMNAEDLSKIEKLYSEKEKILKSIKCSEKNLSLLFKDFFVDKKVNKNFKRRIGYSILDTLFNKISLSSGNLFYTSSSGEKSFDDKAKCFEFETSKIVQDFLSLDELTPENNKEISTISNSLRLKLKSHLVLNGRNYDENSVDDFLLKDLFKKDFEIVKNKGEKSFHYLSSVLIQLFNSYSEFNKFSSLKTNLSPSANEGIKNIDLLFLARRLFNSLTVNEKIGFFDNCLKFMKYNEAIVFTDSRYVEKQKKVFSTLNIKENFNLYFDLFSKNDFFKDFFPILFFDFHNDIKKQIDNNKISNENGLMDKVKNQAIEFSFFLGNSYYKDYLLEKAMHVSKKKEKIKNVALSSSEEYMENKINLLDIFYNPINEYFKNVIKDEYVKSKVIEKFKNKNQITFFKVEPPLHFYIFPEFITRLSPSTNSPEYINAYSKNAFGNNIFLEKNFKSTVDVFKKFNNYYYELFFDVNYGLVLEKELIKKEINKLSIIEDDKNKISGQKMRF